MPAASYGLRPNLNKRSFSPTEEGSRLFVACFLHTSRRYTFDLDKESTHGQPASCRARPVNVDDDLQNSMWIHGLGGERLPAMSYVRSFAQTFKNDYFFAIGGGSRFLLSSVFYTPAAKGFFQTPGRRPPHITGLCVNSVTIGWVGAPSERAPRSDFMTQPLLLPVDVWRGLGSPTRVSGGFREHRAELSRRVKNLPGITRDRSLSRQET